MFIPLFAFGQQKDDAQLLENLAKANQDQKGQFFVAAQLYGGKIGYMKNWGANLSVGKDLKWKDFSVMLGISRKILGDQKYQWNLYPLAGIVNTFYTDSEYYWYEMGFGYGAGTDFSIGHLYLNADIFWDTQQFFHWMTGIGYRFKL